MKYQIAELIQENYSALDKTTIIAPNLLSAVGVV